MNNDEILYLTQEEYNIYEESIDNLLINLGRIQERILDLRQEDPKAKKMDELLYFKEGIKERIEEKRSVLKNIVIVDKTEKKSYADIGDVLKIKTYYLDQILEEECELVLGDSDIDVYPEKVSINSPKGKAIYKTNIGDSCYFDLFNEKIKVDVLEKIDVKKLEKKL